MHANLIYGLAYLGLISFEISKNRYGNLKVKSAAVSKLMTFAVELRAPQH
jgi:Holliday junction resolvase